MIDTGYIDTQSSNQYGFSQCALTARGLETLKSTPKSVQINETIGEKIVYALRTDSMEAATEAAKAAISAGISVIPPL
ncbi:MAG: hypothetical protein JMN24_04265 [gamma proteobacterium endosymbiont of Lamellibrachia anaximandri]|nr:hypothetical protein [gamma proteobacterium endosymbiont of Lamellibrachia anaximandri]